MQSMIANYRQKVHHLQKLEIRLKWRTQRLNSKPSLQTLYECSSWDEQQDWISTLPTSGIMCPELEAEEDWISEFIPKTKCEQENTPVALKRSESEETLVVDHEKGVDNVLDSFDDLCPEDENSQIKNMDIVVDLAEKEDTSKNVSVTHSIHGPSKWNSVNSVTVSHERVLDNETEEFPLKWLLNPDDETNHLKINDWKESSTEWKGLTECFRKNLSYFIQLEAQLVSRCAIQCLVRDDPNDLTPKDLRWHLGQINGAFLSTGFSCHSNLSEILFWRGLNIGKLSPQVLATKVLNALVAFNFLDSEYLEFSDTGFRTENVSGTLLCVFIHRFQIIEFFKSQL